MTITEINDECNDKEFRCEVIYPIFGIPQGAFVGHALSEEIMDYDKSLIEALGITDKDYDEFEHPDFIEAFLQDKNKNGFVGKFSKPVAKYRSNDGYLSSWGHYRTTWIYNESIVGLFSQAKMWAWRLQEEYKAEFLKSDAI